MIWNNTKRSGGLFHHRFKFKRCGKIVRKSESMELISNTKQWCWWLLLRVRICGPHLFIGSLEDSCTQNLCQLLSYNGVQDSLRKIYCLQSVNPRTQRFLWRRIVLAYSYLPWLMDGPFPIFQLMIHFPLLAQRRACLNHPWCTIILHLHQIPSLPPIPCDICPVSSFGHVSWHFPCRPRSGGRSIHGDVSSITDIPWTFGTCPWHHLVNLRRSVGTYT